LRSLEAVLSRVARKIIVVAMLHRRGRAADVLVDHRAGTYIRYSDCAIADHRPPQPAETQPFVQAFKRAPTTGPSVRVVVIGGMSFTGFWADLSKRYEEQRGVRVELISTGEKE